MSKIPDMLFETLEHAVVVAKRQEESVGMGQRAWITLDTSMSRPVYRLAMGGGCPIMCEWWDSDGIKHG